MPPGAERRKVLLLCLAGVFGLAACHPQTVAGAAVGGAVPVAGSTPAGSGCITSGMTIPAGTYVGAVKATLTTQMRFTTGGVTIPDAGGGTEAMHGTVRILSTGASVTGTITLPGLGLSQVGLPGTPQVHSVDNGELVGRLSGSADDPKVSGALSGEWASLDAPVGNTRGSATRTVNAGLHVTRAGCDAVSGDVIPMFAEFAAPAAQYLTISGSGAWTADRS